MSGNGFYLRNFSTFDHKNIEFLLKKDDDMKMMLRYPKNTDFSLYLRLVKLGLDPFIGIRIDSELELELTRI